MTNLDGIHMALQVRAAVVDGDGIIIWSSQWRTADAQPFATIREAFAAARVIEDPNVTYQVVKQ